MLADPLRFDAGRWPDGDPALVYLRLQRFAAHVLLGLLCGAMAAHRPSNKA